MLVIGDLEVPPKDFERYLGLAVVASSRDDWLSELMVHTASEGATVGELLEQLPERVNAEAGSWLKIDVARAVPRIAVRGALVEDDFTEHGVDLAELFRVAANVGGVGELAFLDYQVIPSGEQDPEQCYLVRVASGESSVVHPSTVEQRKILLSDGFRALARDVLETLDEGTRAVFEAEMARRWKRLAKKRPKEVGR
jgi:hypothetical protein